MKKVLAMIMVLGMILSIGTVFACNNIPMKHHQKCNKTPIVCNNSTIPICNNSTTPPVVPICNNSTPVVPVCNNSTTPPVMNNSTVPPKGLITPPAVVKKEIPKTVKTNETVSNETIPMQHTGVPIGLGIVGLLSIAGGMGYRFFRR